ncbi:MAG: copper oxidase [Gammaproteobacteria bacterium]|nr:copper oxidase [Gammaproteobacteria bacterium]MBT4145984.1 copper oxidase [Gammaproteobacteria bacterium]MBT5965889.1 copper oxidase [Gammaproteobacteria bacterium]MBT6420631.1 copper oxidase [Gammaproteobacteria bacterium]
MTKYQSIIAIALVISPPVFAEKEFEKHNNMMDHGNGHLMDMTGGMVMGQNTDVLPGGCDRIAATKEITVHAGHKYAEKFPGRMFAYDVQEYQFEPCTKVTVNFVNDDDVRHQWMMHGLPKYIYPKGMFHMELTGPGKISGTLIFPPGDKTYLVHCDMAQHMEKGMKGQLKIGKGDGDLPSIPGVTAYVIQDDYSDSIADKSISDTVVAEITEMKRQVIGNNSFFSGLTVIGLAIGLILAPLLARRFKGMTPAEVITYIFDLVKQVVDVIVKVISWLIGLVKK